MTTCLANVGDASLPGSLHLGAFANRAFNPKKLKTASQVPPTGTGDAGGPLPYTAVGPLSARPNSQLSIVSAMATKWTLHDGRWATATTAMKPHKLRLLLTLLPPSSL